MIIVNLTHDIPYLLRGFYLGEYTEECINIPAFKGHLPKQEREKVRFLVDADTFANSDRNDVVYADDNDIVKDRFGREIGYSQLRTKSGPVMRRGH